MSMRRQDAAAIRGLRLFQAIRDDTFEHLVETSFLQHFPPGIVLIQENDPADFLHVVAEGLVEMFATTAGRETTLHIVRPVGLFILAAVLNEQVYLQSARTLKKSRILMIPAGKVRAAMHSDPEFMDAIILELAHGYRAAIKDLKNQKLRNGTERLANWLLRREIEQEASGIVMLQFEKKILASLLGMTPENLSRAFAALRIHGVKVSGSRIDLSRPNELARFANPDQLIDD
jgi:CRP/FNR family transcriptional activator FtrB